MNTQAVIVLCLFGAAMADQTVYEDPAAVQDYYRGK